MADPDLGGGGGGGGEERGLPWIRHGIVYIVLPSNNVRGTELAVSKLHSSDHILFNHQMKRKELFGFLISFLL